MSTQISWLSSVARRLGLCLLAFGLALGVMAVVLVAGQAHATTMPRPFFLTPDWMVSGELPGDYFGKSVGTAGDVNGDGYDDIIIGDPVHARAYLYLGSVSGLGYRPAFTVTGEALLDQFGEVVATAGDVNGDGYADVIVGAWFYNSETGRTYVYHGSENGLNTTPAFIATGEEPFSYFGRAVGTAGDVNADGYDDVIIGAFQYFNATGRAYVYLGSANGLGATPAFTATGETSFDGFGVSVGTAGNVNADGYADIIVGALWTGGAGRAYVYQGAANGLSPTPVFSVSGAAPYDRLGISVRTAGDVNGDGYSDVLIGAMGWYTSTGWAYVYTGSVNGLYTTPAIVAAGETANDGFGSLVRPGGDINADGYDDVIIGAPNYLTQTGRIYIYLGTASGLSATPTFTLTGEAPYDFYGETAGTAGDVNGDGYADLIIGAWGYSNFTGRAYAYYGSAFILGFRLHLPLLQR